MFGYFYKDSDYTIVITVTSCPKPIFLVLKLTLVLELWVHLSSRKWPLLDHVACVLIGPSYKPAAYNYMGSLWTMDVLSMLWARVEYRILLAHVKQNGVIPSTKEVRVMSARTVLISGNVFYTSEPHGWQCFTFHVQLSILLSVCCSSGARVCIRLTLIMCVSAAGWHVVALLCHIVITIPIPVPIVSTAMHLYSSQYPHNHM